ncbi:hypothetical protein ASPZODRAFT_132224, partial [Penicilliopsis zonata CBS 506.65]
MTMVIESQNRQYGGMGFDSVYHHSLPHHPAAPPQFTDPWAAVAHTTSHPTPSLYATSIASNPMNLSSIKQEDAPRPAALSMPYSSIPVSAPSLVAGTTYAPAPTAPTAPTAATTSYTTTPDIMAMQHEMPRSSFEQASTYTTASPLTTFPPATYPSLAYGPSLHPQHAADARRLSHAERLSQPPAPTFGDALDASRGMVALSQDLTPRNIYGPRASRGSATGAEYGFPSTHSSASSISSAGNNYPYYSASVGSVESSVTDYSSTSESYDTSRTLPRPSNLLSASVPPGPQSMMSQFSSKMPSNTQKKHKCKVCDKRFTRPSSLQTHMYSHTGEKPFACDVEGCGRHFSVVSNLRRHKKVHKGEKETGSGEDEE